MRRGHLSEYFVGVAAKVLRDTEVNPFVSNGHELQGIGKFRKFLGDSATNDTLPVTYVWITDEEPPVTLPLSATWYDARRNQPHRNPEYRFYYPPEAEEVVYKAKAGDTLVLCQPRNGPLLAIFCPRESSVARQILWLFGLAEPAGNNVVESDLGDGGKPLDLVGRYILDLIGIEIIVSDDRLLERLTGTFGVGFPPTRSLSHFAREELSHVDGRSDPDAALLAWMDYEERLFMTLESHLVGERLMRGFVRDDRPDVDDFIKYSLGVQNRRKSRAGWALANHVEALMRLHGLAFKREATTEKRAGPDFLFPGEGAYHDENWPSDQLTMLAVKTSCKDRWRQVLAEADRIDVKHLLTLEPSISLTQTNEMKKEKLRLVLPSQIHSTYVQAQRLDLMSVSEFIGLVSARQNAFSHD